MTTLEGQLLTPEGLQPGRLHFGAQIETIELLPASTDDVYLLPGFIDTHVHGGGGGDTMDGPEGVRRLVLTHVQYGTTTVLPTTMTARWDEVISALRGVRQVMDQGGIPGGPDILGAHLEGPFISPQRLGAQPPHTQLPTRELVEEALATGSVRAVTMAPELLGALDAARLFVEAGVRVGLGHDAWPVLDEVQRLGGRPAATHTFNAMGGLMGRDPGPLGAVLTHPATFLELIVDGHHLHPAAAALAVAAGPERALLITDAIRATGLGDGPSELGGQPVQVQGGRASLADGTLAGSVLTLDAALRRMVASGFPLPLVSRLLSLNPARSLGLTDRGELREGQRADLVVLDRDLRVRAVYVAGEPVAGPDLAAG